MTKLKTGRLEYRGKIYAFPYFILRFLARKEFVRFYRTNDFWWSEKLNFYKQYNMSIDFRKYHYYLIRGAFINYIYN